MQKVMQWCPELQISVNLDCNSGIIFNTASFLNANAIPLIRTISTRQICLATQHPLFVGPASVMV